MKYKIFENEEVLNAFCRTQDVLCLNEETNSDHDRHRSFIESDSEDECINNLVFLSFKSFVHFLVIANNI